MSIIPLVLIITLFSSQIEARSHFGYYSHRPHSQRHSDAYYPLFKRAIDYSWFPEKRIPPPLVKEMDEDSTMANYMAEGNAVAQDIIGDLRSLLTEVNYAGTVLAQAAKAYAVPAPPGVIGLQSDPDDPKRLLRIS